jgi:hypothetical protein
LRADRSGMELGIVPPQRQSYGTRARGDPSPGVKEVCRARRF